MLPQAEIERYGGKAAILNHIREQLPDMPIPPYVVHEYGQWLWSIRRELKGLGWPRIVRSSSPHEYADFEGIFDSIPNLNAGWQVSDAIKRVERSALSDRAKKYARQHGHDLSKRIHTIIQEQSSSAYAGVMMKHPNNPDLIFMNYCTGESHARDQHSILFNTKSRKPERNQDYNYDEYFSLDDACYLADVYEKIESLKDIADGYSLFIEFGWQPFALYQVRPFKKIETADFEVPTEEKCERKVLISTELTFGITKPEGNVYPVLRGFSFEAAGRLIRAIRDSIDAMDPDLKTDRYIMNGPDRELLADFIERSLENPPTLDQVLYEGCGGRYNPFEKGQAGMLEQQSHYLTKRLIEHNVALNEQLGEHCLMMDSVGSEKYDVDLTVPNMRAAILGNTNRFLTHNTLRVLKQANVWLGYNLLEVDDLFRQTSSGDKVRIISNGKKAVVMRE